MKKITNAFLADAGATALATLPLPATLPAGLDAYDCRAARQAEREARDIAAHAAWAGIIRTVFEAASVETHAKTCITTWAGVLRFDPDGEEYGHYREMPTADEVEAYIASLPASRAVAALRNFSEAADSLESQQFDRFLAKSSAP